MLVLNLYIKIDPETRQDIPGACDELIRLDEMTPPETPLNIFIQNATVAPAAPHVLGLARQTCV